MLLLLLGAGGGLDAVEYLLFSRCFFVPLIYLEIRRPAPNPLAKIHS